MPKPKSLRPRGMTTIEALLVAAAFIIVGVIGVMVFQGMGKSMSEALRANAIVTADRGGFDVTLEVLNGRASALQLYFSEAGGQPNEAQQAYCIGSFPVIAGQSITCRFTAQLSPGTQYTYIIYVTDADTRKNVQIAKGVVTVGIS
ncbi:hypothetical protein Pogu_0604 [Pyrobaculum oguniense TE7]|uniref:Uncharacterized protein n=1 Tax=Pyrobaculum oguniense (strain DSM 13380 / JCM 10595 / TE7) TaxID=698757 RepID=H6Q7X4_PYROT|nr:hypothetical protein Pogu_0604 [Pyrobaculum oguniense TE7]